MCDKDLYLVSVLGRRVVEGWGKWGSWEGGLLSGGAPGPSGACLAPARSRPLLGSRQAEHLFVWGGGRPRVGGSGGWGGVGAAPVALGGQWREGVR